MNWVSKFFSLRSTPTEQPYGTRRTFGFGNSPAVSTDSSMRVSAFYRGVIYISTQIAKLPWDVKDKKNNVLEEDRVAYLLNLAPNAEMNAYTFRLAMIQHAIIHGNAYAEIERDMVGRPVNIWPINGLGVEPYRDLSTGILGYRVSGYRDNLGNPVLLDARNVFHLKNFHTRDGITGEGVVEYGKNSLGISLGGDRMAAGLFNNAGLPSGVLKTEKTMSDAAYARLQDSWKEQYSGDRAGSVAILEEGVQFEALNMDPQVLQFLESRKFGVLEIARFLGLPPTKLFDVTGATFSNVENANLEVATDTLDAWTVNLEMEADVKLLSNRFGGKFTELDLYSVFRGDSTTRSNYFSKLMQMGAITPNEVRMKEGMAPYKDGDRYFIATNNFTPADRLDEVFDAQIKAKEPVKTTDPVPATPKPEDAAVSNAVVKFLERK